MKKYLKLILAIIAIFTITIIPNNSMAATHSMDVGPNSVTVGDTITVTIKVTAAQWNLTLTANGNTLNTWTETQNYTENLSKTFTASYKTTEEGTVNFVLSGDISDVDTSNPNFNTEVNSTKSVTVKEKAPSSGNNSSNNTTGNNSSGSTNTTGNTSTSTEPKEPTFTSVNKTVYTTGQVNLRASWSTNSSATTVAQGTELTLTGTSTEEVNGYVWYRVKYNGSTKYIASHLITYTKPEEEEKSDNNDLYSLEIEGVTLTPSFSKDVLQYTATVGDEIANVIVNAKAESSVADVEIQGDKNLQEGENTVKVVVTAEDGTTKTYSIVVTKGEKSDETTTTETTSGLKLYQLQIAGVEFGDIFNPDTYSYELTLNIAVDNLDITAIANQEDAKVEIIGNENFVEGQNTVMIILTSADGTETANYQIKVNMPVSATEIQNNIQFYIIGAGIFVVLLIVFIVIMVIRRRNMEEVYEDGEDIGMQENLEREEDLQYSEQDKKTTLDEFLDNSEVEEKPKRSKGKHSV